MVVLVVVTEPAARAVEATEAAATEAEATVTAAAITATEVTPAMAREETVTMPAPRLGGKWAGTRV